ncbi:phosphonate C-P lyase system protein PhnH [Pseudonocardia sp. TRM90224]|uniref:phosphonate C-P lyase system protein PhnH n=1 Tax=Pseudonocardia sp. TRM90224 TaxID=2812678 RepID=UPI001E434285|nr:phosphonate C-P lyase system protein PhnH [Pseudonocardia sp. TRM90224]
MRTAARESQQTFRTVLDAFARPGTPARLADGECQESHFPGTWGQESGFPGTPPALLATLALADLDTPVCVLGEGEWGDVVATATSAPLVRLPDARLVAALRPVTLDELRSVRVGRAAAPEEAALVTLAVDALSGGPQVRLRGPGVRDEVVIGPVGLPGGWPAARAVAEFPAGADLLLVTPDGGCIGIPRSTTTEEV